jgi:hypothetical protein
LKYDAAAGMETESEIRTASWREAYESTADLVMAIGDAECYTFTRGGHDDDVRSP